MPPELSLENLQKDLSEIKTLVAGIKIADHETEEEKRDAAKKAMDEKHEEEKKEAKKAARTAAMKKAMDEPDEEKRDAAMRKAMDEDPEKKHEGMDDHETPKEKEAMEEEKKEHDAQIASIINDKKTSLINQILTANRIINPAGLKEIEARLKKASITDIQKEYDIVKPFIAGVETTTPIPQQAPIPFFANITPADIDANALTAASPASDFAKLSTKELLEETQ